MNFRHNTGTWLAVNGIQEIQIDFYIKLNSGHSKHFLKNRQLKVNSLKTKIKFNDIFYNGREFEIGSSSFNTWHLIITPMPNIFYILCHQRRRDKR